MIFVALKTLCSKREASSVTIGGTGISIDSARGRSWLALSRDAIPPRERIGV